MNDAEIIKNLKALKSIEPNKDWEIYTRSEILSQRPKETVKPKVNYGSVFSSWMHRPAFASAVSFAFLLSVATGTFVASRDTLPGDALYGVKKISENVEVALASQQDKTAMKLELVDKRLEELSRVTKEEDNQGERLAASIEQTQNSISEVSKALQEASEDEREELAEIVVPKIETFKTEKKTIEESLNAVIMDEAEEELVESARPYYNIYIKNQIEILIADIESRTLTEEEQEMLAEAKDCLKEEDLSKAFEIVSRIYNNN